MIGYALAFCELALSFYRKPNDFVTKTYVELSNFS